MKNIFIGIDFSKEKVDVAIIKAEGLSETAQRVSSEFKNTVSGFKQLVKWVEESADVFNIVTSVKGIGTQMGDKRFCSFRAGHYFMQSHHTWHNSVMRGKCGVTKTQGAGRYAPLPWAMETIGLSARPSPIVLKLSKYVREKG